MTPWPPAPLRAGEPEPPPARLPQCAGHPALAPAPGSQCVRLPVHRPVLTYVFLGLITLVFLGQLASEQVLGGDLLLALRRQAQCRHRCRASIGG